MPEYTHPVCGYLFPSREPEEFDPVDIATQLAEMEADPLTDLQGFEQALYSYLDLDDFELIRLYRSRAGY